MKLKKPSIFCLVLLFAGTLYTAELHAVDEKDLTSTITTRLGSLETKLSAIQTDLKTLLEKQQRTLEEVEKVKVRAFRA